VSYSVKEIFYTLQGEGANTGRAAVFCRFAGCNLWSGREEDRGAAICKFCDTNFVGVDGPNGGRYETADDLARSISDIWSAPKTSSKPFVVFTGGEPLLQLNVMLLESLHEYGFEIAVETNGTQNVPKGLDWVCVSPKANTELLVRSGDELKLVFPQSENSPEQYKDLDFKHFFLQPLDGDKRDFNTRLAVAYCLKNPKWRLSLQTHKALGIP